MKYGKQATRDRKQAFLNALVATLGIVTTASSACGVNRRTHYQWMTEDLAYANAVNDIHEIAMDFAETALHKQIREGITSATIFYLKTRGRKRGYIEKDLLVDPNADDMVVEIAQGGIPEWLDAPDSHQVIQIEQTNEQE